MGRLLTILILTLLLVIGTTVALTIYAESVQGSTGLKVSYEVHLIIAEEWVGRLNESGLNSTLVLNLINNAKYEASQGDYLTAITLLNRAISISAKSIANYLSNDTIIVLNNYNYTINNYNSYVSSTINNGSVINTLINALNYISNEQLSPGNASQIVQYLELLNRTLQNAVVINPGLKETVNTALLLVNNLRNELTNDLLIEHNTTKAQLTLLKTEISIVTELENNTRLKERMLFIIISHWNGLVLNEANAMYENITNTLGLSNWLKLWNSVITCLSTINNSIPTLAMGIASPEQVVGNYSMCINRVEILHILASNEPKLNANISYVANELTALGLTNYSRYVIHIGNQCNYELVNAAINGNMGYVNTTINKCLSLVSEYGERVNYVNLIINVSNYKILELNRTITQWINKYRLNANIAMLCWVRINENISSSIYSIINSILNGTLSPENGLNLVNQYFTNLIMNSSSIIAGCLGQNITPGPGRYIPMIGVQQNQGAPQVIGLGLELGGNGLIKVLLLIFNPTQNTLYINGLRLGGLYCSFSNDIEVQPQSQGRLVVTMYVGSNGSVNGTITYSSGADMLGTQRSLLICNGTQTFTANTNYTGYLLLTNNQELQFTVQSTNLIQPFNW